MSRRRREKRFLVEKIDANGYTIRVHDRRTGKHRDYYPAEFVYGCMDYCETTAQYPNYVHDEVWRKLDAVPVIRI
jgi:hypothetical protein